MRFKIGQNCENRDLKSQTTKPLEPYKNPRFEGPKPEVISILKNARLTGSGAGLKQKSAQKLQVWNPVTLNPSSLKVSKGPSQDQDLAPERVKRAFFVLKSPPFWDLEILDV